MDRLQTCMNDNMTIVVVASLKMDKTYNDRTCLHRKPLICYIS